MKFYKNQNIKEIEFRMRFLCYAKNRLFLKGNKSKNGKTKMCKDIND